MQNTTLRRWLQGVALISAAAAAALGVAQPSFAQITAAPITPLEALSCRFAEGKGRKDLDDFGRTLSSWMDEGEPVAQSLEVWWPQLHGAELDHDFLWVTAWPDAVTMGMSMGAYHGADGAALRQRFEEIAHCREKRNFSLVTMRAPAEPGVYGPLEIAQCTLRIGASLADALNNVREWVDYLETTGSTAGHWLLFKSYGAGADASYNFIWAVTYGSYEDFGYDYDRFTNGDGADTYNQLFGLQMTCENPRLYGVQLVRARQW